MEYHPSEASDGLLRLQNALALMCVCVCAGQRAVCSLHRLHMRLIPPHVLWCCFPVLHSFRGFLVPKPRLRTTDSGNSFVFPSPEYWRRKVLHLFPQGRGLSRLPQFFFCSPHRHFGKLPFSSPVPESLIFCTKPRALDARGVPPTPFLSVWRVNHSGRLQQEGQSCGAGIVMLGDANSYCARPLMKR